MTYGTNRTHLLIQHVAAARAALPAGFAALERDGGPGQQCKDDGLHDPPSVNDVRLFTLLQERSAWQARNPLRQNAAEPRDLLEVLM